MKWENTTATKPVKSWCENLEEGALQQALDLANHPCLFSHVALMPDAHQGYGMPIGGVIALDRAIIPNAVGVDIGCGMRAVKTTCKVSDFEDMRIRREWHDKVRKLIPCGEGNAHQKEQEWDGFDENHDVVLTPLDLRNLGTLGGGNHFLEMQKDEDGNIWMMVHSGSRNLGKRICDEYNNIAKDLCEKFRVKLGNPDIAFLPTGIPEAQGYIKAMNFALKYARESRKRMIENATLALAEVCANHGFLFGVEYGYDVHHNYAALENHLGHDVWVHRKGATSAKAGEIGIIPGSMGSASYIVEGLGNPMSFMSCSHGAGRAMSRTAATETLTVADCDKAMEGIVCDRWKKARFHGKKHEGKDLFDLSEAPGAYKDIDTVIAAETDLVKPIVKLLPIANIKG